MEDVETALKFWGGGHHDVGPGQVTDDSEMALSLMRGILRSEDDELDQKYIPEEYLRWYHSDPRDIGTTTKSAMKLIKKHFDEYKDKDNMDLLIQNIAESNKNSWSNGWLMRATPLSVYWYGLPDDKIYEFTKKDVNLTHSHPIAVQTVTWYNLAIAHLLNNFEDYKGAIK